jgi:MarR family transcriptional repressor of emrRAB
VLGPESAASTSPIGAPPASQRSSNDHIAYDICVTHTTRETANLLGALALAVTDRVGEAAAAVAGHGASGPAALVVLDGDAGGATIDALCRILGLTHSGAVRLVDRLVAKGLAERRIGRDGRSVAVHLTPLGRRTARRVASAREAVLEQVLGVLAPAQREQANTLLTALLEGLADGPGDPLRICRLCAGEVCGHARGTCPVTHRTNARVER